MKNSKIDNFLKVKKELGNKVILNEPMAFHTTLDIGGPARLLSEVNEDEELIKLVKLAFKYKIPYIVIGEGSDLLVSDLGFMGFVIINKVDDVRINGSKIMVKSGTNLQKFINFTIGKGYSGIEKMSGIPGTVGGAIYGNAGAYGQTISDHILKVKTFNGKIIKWYTKTDCKFSYRDSIFKKKNDIITTTTTTILGCRTFNSIAVISPTGPPPTIRNLVILSLSSISTVFLCAPLDHMTSYRFT